MLDQYIVEAYSHPYEFWCFLSLCLYVTAPMRLHFHLAAIFIAWGKFQEILDEALWRKDNSLDGVSLGKIQASKLTTWAMRFSIAGLVLSAVNGSPYLEMRLILGFGILLILQLWQALSGFFTWNSCSEWRYSSELAGPRYIGGGVGIFAEPDDPPWTNTILTAVALVPFLVIFASFLLMS